MGVMHEMMRYRHVGSPRTEDYPEDDWSPIYPEQLSRNPRWRGEHMLLLAMVADALNIATRTAKCPCSNRFCGHTAEKERARVWLTSNEEIPYSFVWACLHIGANPETLRRRLYDGAEPMKPVSLEDLPLFQFGAGALGQGSSRKTA